MINCFELIIARRIDVISSLDCHAEYAFPKGRDGGEGNELWTYYTLDGRDVRTYSGAEWFPSYVTQEWGGLDHEFFLDYFTT